MVLLQELVSYTNGFLDIQRYRDYCPNGLQVQGKNEVQTIISGVTASQAFLDAAITAGADALLVHHGYFWSGEDPCITGMKRQRLRRLLEADVSLLAYHLPLDAHSDYGNNAQLGKILQFAVAGSFGRGPGDEVGLHGFLSNPMSPGAFAEHLKTRLGRAPMHISGGANEIRNVAWCTGAAQSYIDQAVRLGVDAFVSGEISEQTVHIARESGIHYFAAGHHATERYGVQALGQHLAERFGIEHRYIDIDNPV
ncbi:MAG: Nif3-like dinuclear metal center hexameric protein [Gammaproteobacteria bacterium]|nr:Nif3-like dinuclear metal center hexameric protein [Gammaproteobacteria bacterium]